VSCLWNPANLSSPGSWRSEISTASSVPLHMFPNVIVHLEICPGEMIPGPEIRQPRLRALTLVHFY
jgi:hypothetical protein